METDFNGLSSPDEAVRRRSADRLDNVSDRQAVIPLIAALQNTDWYVRWKVVDALGRLGDAQVVDPILFALSDENAGVREAAAEALGSLRDTRGVDPLLTSLSDSERNVRAKAAAALGNLRDLRAVNFLINALKDGDTNVRIYAAIALGDLGEPSAVGPLGVAAADATDFFLRCASAEALVKLGNSLGKDILTNMLQSSDSYACDAAAGALSRMENRKLQSTPIKAQIEAELGVPAETMVDIDSVRSVIADVTKIVGAHGGILIEEGDGTETSVDVVEGMAIGGGYLSRDFVTDTERHRVVLVEPDILLQDQPFRRVTPMPIIGELSRSDAPLLIVGVAFDDETLDVLLEWKRSRHSPCAAIQVDGDTLACVEFLIGCKTRFKTNDSLPSSVARLGRAQRVVVETTRTYIIGSRENLPIAVKALDKDDDLYRRMPRILAGVAVIYVGGASQAERKHRLACFERELERSTKGRNQGVTMNDAKTSQVLTMKKWWEFWK